VRWLCLPTAKLAVRDKATNGLMAAGELAIVTLQRLLEKPPSEEAAQRAALVFKQLAEPVLNVSGSWKRSRCWNSFGPPRPWRCSPRD
jgi:hypothetical protein